MSETGEPSEGKGPEAMTRLILTDGRYPLDAFEFLHEGLERAVQSQYGSDPGGPGQRHVSGPQLCKALRDHAIG